MTLTVTPQRANIYHHNKKLNERSVIYI